MGNNGALFSIAQNYGSGNPPSRESRAADNSNYSADSSSARRNDPGSSERLIDRVTNPIAWLMQFRFRESWNWPLNDTGPDSQTFEFRPTIPFKAWDQENLLRITVPYKNQGSDSPGLDKVQIFDAIMFEPEWGKWGIGPDIRFDSRPAPVKMTFQMGPVFGAVTKIQTLDLWLHFSELFGWRQF